MSPSKIMIIRHAEKAEPGDGEPGVDRDRRRLAASAGPRQFFRKPECRAYCAAGLFVRGEPERR